MPDSKKTYPKIPARDLMIVAADEFGALDDHPIDALSSRTYARLEKLVSWFVLRAPLTQITRLANPSCIDMFKSDESPRRGSRTFNRSEFEDMFLKPMEIDCSKFEFAYTRNVVKPLLEVNGLTLNNSTVFLDGNGNARERAVCFVGKGENGKSEDSCIESICRHVRNAFAHGRVAISESNEEPVVFLEDGATPRGVDYEESDKPSGQLIEVRFRMVVKLSTLETWYKTLVPNA